MGLDISVGSLAWCLANGEFEGAQWTQRDLSEVTRVLAANGFPAHAEPQTLPKFRDRRGLRGMPYSWLHYLRRALAFARQAPAEFAPVDGDADPADDPRIDYELSVSTDSHLICHSDAEGYYVPVDFPDPLYDDTDALVGGIVGSSHAAMRELVLVAPLLNIRLRNGTLSDAQAKQLADEDGGPLYIERQVWLQLHEAFRLSIEHGTAVKFC